MGFPLTVANAKERPCGGCRACCTAVGVPELGKKMYQPCVHECGRGCAVYEQRPDSCRTYYCLWQAGFLEGDERRRPDNLGVIFDYRSSAGPDVVCAWETRPGAADEEAAAYLIEKIARKFVVYLRRHASDKRRLYGPVSLLQLFHFTEVSGQ